MNMFIKLIVHRKTKKPQTINKKSITSIKIRQYKAMLFIQNNISTLFVQQNFVFVQWMGELEIGYFIENVEKLEYSETFF